MTARDNSTTSAVRSDAAVRAVARPGPARAWLDASLLLTALVLGLVTLVIEQLPSHTLIPSNPATETVMATVIAAASTLLVVLAWLRFRALGDDALRLESGAYAAFAAVSVYFVVLGMVRGVPPPDEHSSLPAHVAFAVGYLAMGVLLIAAASTFHGRLRPGWRQAAVAAAPALFAMLVVIGVSRPGIWLGVTQVTQHHADGAGHPLAIAIHVPVAIIFALGAFVYRSLYLTRRQPAHAALSFAFVVGVLSQLPLPIQAGPGHAAGVTIDELARLAFVSIVLAGMVLQVGTDARRLARADIDLQRLHRAELERKALEDRERLAREIHDGIAQDLWLAKLTYGQLRARLPRDADVDQLARLVDDVLDEAVAGTRQAIAWTQAAATSDTPFSDALRRLAREMSDRFDVDIAVDTLAEPALDPPVEIELLRITQEALRNAVKHSRASAVSVVLASSHDRLLLTIEDDGTGFDETTVRPGAFGLQTMRRRAALIGGRLTLTTAPTRGTRVVIELALDTSARSADAPGNDDEPSANAADRPERGLRPTRPAAQATDL